MNCLACTVVIGGSYVHLKETVERDSRKFKWNDDFLCYDCFNTIKTRGWLVKELKGRDVMMYFKDKSLLCLSQDRFARLNLSQPWRYVKSDAVFFAGLSINVVHLVKIYSRSESFLNRLNKKAPDVFMESQLRMF